MATSTIPNHILDTINNAGRVDYRELASDTPKLVNQTGGMGSVALGKGVYVALSQASTSTGYSGRAYCAYSGNVVTTVDFMPPTMPTGFGNFQLVQLIIVKSSSETVNRIYWDSQATGAKHIWQIYRIL